MKKMKFYLMALLAVVVAFTSCGEKPGPEPEDPDKKPTTTTEVELNVKTAIYYTNYSSGSFEHYVIFFEDAKNTNNQYYAEVVSFGNDKQGPTQGKYTLQSEVETVTGDILLGFSKTIIEGTDTIDLDALTATMEVKSSQIIINATYGDGSEEKLVYNAEMPAFIDFPGQGEPTEANEFAWTANLAMVEIDPTNLGMFSLMLVDTVKMQGVQISGFAAASWAQLYDEATGGSTLNEFPASYYVGMPFMDFYNAINQGSAYNAIFTTTYADIMSYNGKYATIIFDGIENGDFKNMYWSVASALIYEGTKDEAQITFQAESYHGSGFTITFNGKLEEEIATATVAPKRLGAKSQDWGTSLFAKPVFGKKPIVKFAERLR